MMDGTQYVTRPEFAYHEKNADERFARDKERIKAQEDDMREVRQLTVQMGEMIKKHDKTIDKHGERLDALERQPGEKWEKAVWVVVVAIITAVVGFVVGKFGV